MSRAPHRRTAAVALAALHDAALLIAVFYAPIFWGQVSIPETLAAGQISASAGQTLIGGVVFLALLAGLLARWAAVEPPARLPNAIHLPALLLLAFAAVSTISSVNPHASKIELSRLLIGFLLFYLVANRATLPAAKPGVVAAAFACSAVLSVFIPIPDEAGLALKMLTVIGVSIAVAVMVTEREEHDPVVWLRNALVLSAALVVALYGWREKFAVASDQENTSWQIFSTFFNPNSLAGFLAMVFPLALGAALVDRVFARRLLWSFCAIALAATIYPTRSKGAMVACGGATLLYLILLARQNLRLRKPVGIALIAGFAAALIAAVVAWQVAPARTWFIEIIGLNTPSNMFRVLTWRGTIRLFEHYPWLGVGPAAFKYVYPMYAIGGYVEAAHQNYLQMFAELGVFGGVVFLWLLGAVIFTGARAVKTARHFADRAGAIGGICAVVALMIHSLLDYDWYIGAINFQFWLIAGMLAYRAHGQRLASPAIEAIEKAPQKRNRQRSQSSIPPSSDLPGRNFRWPAASSRWFSFTLSWGALIVLACLATWLSISVVARNALAQPFVDRGFYYVTSAPSNEAGGMALAQYDNARQLDPGWSEAWEWYGVVLGRMEGLSKGIEAIEHAHELSPTNYRPYSNIGQLYEQEGRWADAARMYEKALALFPNQTRTMRRLAEVNAKNGDQRKALEMYERLDAGEEAPYARYPALYDISVDTNFGFAHYELGRAAQKAHDLGPALKQFDSAIGVISAYFSRAEATDEMLASMGRPREVRPADMRMLEAKTRWRMGQIYQRVGMAKDAQWQRNRSLEIWSGAEQAVADEDSVKIPAGKAVNPQ